MKTKIKLLILTILMIGSSIAQGIPNGPGSGGGGGRGRGNGGGGRGNGGGNSQNVPVNRGIYVVVGILLGIGLYKYSTVPKDKEELK